MLKMNSLLIQNELRQSCKGKNQNINERHESLEEKCHFHNKAENKGRQTASVIIEEEGVVNKLDCAVFTDPPPGLESQTVSDISKD